MTNKSNVEDRYLGAIQPAVDEAMRVDNISPVIRNAIKENKPLNDDLQVVVLEAIKKNPDIKEEIGKLVESNKSVKREKVIAGIISAIVGALITTVIGAIVNSFLTKPK